jgi:hypothetical protein
MRIRGAKKAPKLHLICFERAIRIGLAPKFALKRGESQLIGGTSCSA